MPFVPDSREPSVSVEEHVQRILDGVEPLPPYEQPLLEALGLPVCEQVVAPLDLPVFDNSAMDGYAVVHADVAHAGESEPVHLPVVGEAAAGQTKLFAMSPGTAVKIMTGAPVPQGADAIVPVEWTDGGAATVRITRARTSARATSCWTKERWWAPASWRCWRASVVRRCGPARVRAW